MAGNNSVIGAVKHSYAHYNPDQFGTGDLNMPSKVESKLVALEGDQFAFGEYGKRAVSVNGKAMPTWSAFNPKTHQLFVVDQNAHVLAEGTVSLAADGSGTVHWDAQPASKPAPGPFFGPHGPGGVDTWTNLPDPTNGKGNFFGPHS